MQEWHVLSPLLASEMLDPLVENKCLMPHKLNMNLLSHHPLLDYGGNFKYDFSACKL
jgi:hypothetical protein